MSGSGTEAGDVSDAKAVVSCSAEAVAGDSVAVSGVED